MKRIGWLLLMAAATPAAAQDSFSLSAGLSYSKGRYTTPEDTEILVAPITGRYATGPVRVTATIPYLRVDSIGTVLVGGAMMGPIVIDAADPAARRGVRDGWGDLQLGASYTLPAALVGEVLVDLTARVKLPTARASRGLGTGEADLFVSADLSYPVGDVAPFVNVGYRFLGDPDAFDLRNSVSTSVGASYALGRTFLIASYDFSRSVTTFIPDAHEVFAGVSGEAGGGFGWTAFGTAGLSEGAPDFGLGLLVTYRID